MMKFSPRARWQQWALNFGAILGTICLLMTLLSAVFGIKPLVFVSGSMSPAIPSGSLGLALPVQVGQVQPGQVVSVLNSTGVRVTHRVMENTQAGLILKGDANVTADLEPYPVQEVDRLFASVPGLGYVLTWFSQPWMLGAGVAFCGYLIYLAFFRSGHQPPADTPGKSDSMTEAVAESVRNPEPERQQRRSVRAGGALGAAGAVIVLAAFLVPAAHMVKTQAAFEAEVQGNVALSAGVMAGPTVSCTQNGDKEIIFSWDEVHTAGLTASDYHATVRSTDPSSDIPAEDFEVSPDDRSFSLNTEVSGGLLAKVLGSLLEPLLSYDKLLTVTVSAKYSNGWSSEPYIIEEVRAHSTLLSQAKVSCPSS